MRSLEDIRTRATESRFVEQSVVLQTSLEDLESIEEQMMSIFEVDRACILSDEKVGKRLEPRGVPRLAAPAKDRRSRQCKRSSTLAPTIRVFRDKAEDRYLMFSTSPLTARTHVLLRLDCSTLGRLVSVADLQPLLSEFAGCTCERVRYEGWCALVHLSSHSYQLAMDGLLRAVSAQSFASLAASEVSPLRNSPSPSVEVSLKSSILRFVRPEATGGTLGVRISGASIACDESIDPEPVADSFLAGLRGYGRSPEVSLGSGTLHDAPLGGIAILSGVPNNGWAMLALHEAAFDTSGTVPSLVSIIRDSGVAYELVQSFGGTEHGRFMYWGCKGDVAEFEAFRAAFDVWLSEITDAAGKVESWFLKNWVPLNLAKQRSIHQVLRDVDRAGCYLPSLNVDGELGVGAFAQFLAESSVCRILFENHGSGRVNE